MKSIFEKHPTGCDILAVPILVTNVIIDRIFGPGAPA
jgi:hypothetical protein